MDEDRLQDCLSETGDVTHVAALAVTAASPKEVHKGRFARHVVSNGEVAEYAIDPPARNHNAESVDAVAMLVTGDSSVWHSGDQVVAVLHDGDGLRDDLVTWKLTPTEAWSTVKNGLRKKSQKQFIAALEGPLRKVIRDNAPGLLDSVRSLKFATEKTTDGEVRHGKESMGRSIKSEATGAGAIPPDVTLKVKRWAELEHVCELFMRVEVDVFDEVLTLVATVDDLAEAELGAQEALHGHLRSHLDDDVSVVAGCP